MPITNAAIPLTCGRFGTPNIDAYDVHCIKNANSIRDVVSIMDRIKDWFCHTNRVEAKQCLYTLTHEERNSTERIEAFLRLKELCADTFKDRFKMEITTDGRMNLGIVKDYSSYHSHNTLFNSERQFERLDEYNSEHNRSHLRDRFDGRPAIMNKLLKGSEDYPKNRFITHCKLVHDREVKKGMYKATYTVTSKPDFRSDEQQVHAVDIWSDDNKRMFVGRVEQNI